MMRRNHCFRVFPRKAKGPWTRRRMGSEGISGYGVVVVCANE
jgi:hypothetical protein